MAMRDMLLPEFDHEIANTRKILERVPADRFAWRPHPKSTTLGYLATHIATIADWGGRVLAHEVFDLAPNGQRKPLAEATTAAELLSRFDASVAGGRAAIAAAGDEE